jgi:hypothetical protein
MKLSFSDVQGAHALNQAQGNLANFEAQLKAHLALDWEAEKERLEQAVAHFKGEVARLTAGLHPRIAAHVAEGVHVIGALSRTAIDEPTQAEAEAAAIAKINADQEAAAIAARDAAAKG